MKFRAQDLISAVVTNAIALRICVAVVRGTTMNWQGFLIALAIIAGPEALFGSYTVSGAYAAKNDAERLRGFMTGCSAALVWTFAGPLVADWATPDFNIGGWWQYFVLLAVMVAVGRLYRNYRIWRASARRRRREGKRT